MKIMMLVRNDSVGILGIGVVYMYPKHSGDLGTSIRLLSCQCVRVVSLSSVEDVCLKDKFVFFHPLFS